MHEYIQKNLSSTVHTSEAGGSEQHAQGQKRQHCPFFSQKSVPPETHAQNYLHADAQRACGKHDRSLPVDHHIQHQRVRIDRKMQQLVEFIKQYIDIRLRKN